MQIHHDLQNKNEFTQKEITMSLQYEVSLLRQRNKILAIENQNLLFKISQLEKDLLNKKQIQDKYQRQRRTQSDMKLNQKSELLKLTKCLQKNVNNEGFHKTQIVYQMIKNACSTAQIISEISEIVAEQQNKQNSKPSNMNRLQKLIQERKEKLSVRSINNKQIIHIVKQPTWNESFLVEADLQFILKSSEKLIRRIKRKQISTQQITKIFNDISNYIHLRMNIRKEQKELKIRQRELELGVGCRLVFQQYSERLISLNNEELSKKNAIQQKIFQL